MTDMIEGLVYQRDIRPPRQFDHERLAEEHRANVAEWHNLMAAYDATDPVIIGELGTPKRARWEARELPPQPPPAQVRGLPDTSQACPECDAERQSGVAIADYDHQHFRREYDLRKTWSPIAVVAHRPDPSGRMLPTLLKPGMP